ncbi:MAG: hypothetical protein J7457_06330 [Roseiflexus sp.]|nr:hypothetical protein [Roseiflexus sp.]
MLSTHDKMQTGTPDAAGLLRQWQTRMLDGLLIVLIVVGLLAIIGGGWSDYMARGAEAIPLIVAYTTVCWRSSVAVGRIIWHAGQKRYP